MPPNANQSSTFKWSYWKAPVHKTAQRLLTGKIAVIGATSQLRVQPRGERLRVCSLLYRKLSRCHPLLAVSHYVTIIDYFPEFQHESTMRPAGFYFMFLHQVSSAFFSFLYLLQTVVCSWLGRGLGKNNIITTWHFLLLSSLASYSSYVATITTYYFYWHLPPCHLLLFYSCIQRSSSIRESKLLRHLNASN